MLRLLFTSLLQVNHFSLAVIYFSFLHNLLQFAQILVSIKTPLGYLSSFVNELKTLLGLFIFFLDAMTVELFIINFYARLHSFPIFALTLILAWLPTIDINASSIN